MDKIYFNHHSLDDTLSTFPIWSYTNNASTTQQRVIQQIKEGFTNDIHPDLFDLYSNNFHKGLAMFGKPKPGDEYFELLEHYKLNTAKFAAYKSLLVTKRLKKLLGSDDFEQQAKLELKKFNRFQAAEYNTIVARSRTAKQYKQFQSEADLYPNIEWIRTRSAEPRERHLEFVGLILPQNHKFWDNNQPGNLWNCKCDWRSTDAPASDYVPKDVTPPPGLEGNPASTRELITNSHPYISKANKNAIDDLKNVFYESENIPVSVLAHKEELTDNILTAQILASNFSKLNVRIRPHIIQKGVKNPEFEIDGLLADAKRIESYKGISAAFKNALVQNCKIVIIDFNKHFNIKKSIYLEKVIGRLLWRKNDFETNRIENCILIFGKNAVMVDKNDISSSKLYDLIKGLQP